MWGMTSAKPQACHLSHGQATRRPPPRDMGAKDSPVHIPETNGCPNQSDRYRLERRLQTCISGRYLTALSDGGWPAQRNTPSGGVLHRLCLVDFTAAFEAGEGWGVFHGFRFASPVAPCLRPDGAKTKREDGGIAG